MLLASLTLSSILNAAAARVIERGETPGVQYAVVQAGAIRAAGALGKANIGAGTPVTNQTRFRIGSITKLFTAVAVMQLVERGALHLDDSLARFEPSFPDASAITVRDLLMHRSGIANYLDDAIAAGRVKFPTTPQAIVDSMRSKPLLSTPGTAFAYSNTNYVLLGLIVERLSGVPLHAYYQSNIYAPAGMTQTSAGDAPANVPVAVGYDPPVKKQFAPADPGDMSWYYACGDILSTATDVARFDIALMNGVLLRPSTFRTMIERAQPSTLGKHASYGLGVMTIEAGEGGPFVGHHGGMPGFEADNEMLPSQRFAVISLGNAFTYPTSALDAAAVAALYPQRLSALAAQTRADEASSAASSEPEDPALTQRFTQFFTALLAGSVDKTQLSDPMAAAMTPAAVAQARQLFSTDGTFRQLRYVYQDTATGYRRYHYRAVFSGAELPVLFVLDSADKITGFFLQ